MHGPQGRVGAGDAEVYTAGMEGFEAQKDQPQLPLEGFGEGQEAA